jgi:CSLREA domain-containing protein
MKSCILASNSLCALYNTFDRLDTTALQTNPFPSPVISMGLSGASQQVPVLTVNSTADTVDPNDGKLTLREAIDLANRAPGSQTINFDLGTGAQTITLTGGQLTIQDTLIINGTGNLTIDGNKRSRIFEINGNVSTTLSKLSLVNGSSGSGGAILNGGTINLIDVTLSRNSALVGGGMVNLGAAFLTNTTIDNNTGYLNISNSTFSSNFASLDGGGIYSNLGYVESQSNTFTLNLADSDNDGLGNGGGIRINSGAAIIQNTIVANNFDTLNNNGGGVRHVDLSGNVTDRGNNLIGDGTGSTGWTGRSRVGTSTQRIDPRLSALRNNGGLTQTHALLMDSLALDAGNTTTAPAMDQRGIRRTVADIGAYEALPFNLTVDLLTDENDGNLSAGDLSLREAIRYIGDGGTINFAANVRGTITLDLGELFVDRNLTIQGSGAKELIISGNRKSRVFSIASNVTANISDLSIANGFATFGGGIYNAGNLTLSNLMIRDNYANGSSGIANNNNATLNLYNSTVYNNACPYGSLSYSLTSSAAIGNLGTMTIQNSTISHNQSWASVFNNGTLMINASTIADTLWFSNTDDGGKIPNSIGVFNGNFIGVVGVTKVKNSIIARNTSDVRGEFISEGYNLIGSIWKTGNFIEGRGFVNGINGDQVGTLNAPIDPKLGDLKDNGGPTWTRALLVGSPALNAANPYDRPQTDQRGIDRGSRPDIGAYENAASIARSDNTTVRRGGSITIPVLANDFDTDGDRFTIVSYSNPIGGRLTRNSDGTFTYASRSLFLTSDLFTYTISDGKGETSTATVQIRIV